MNTFIRYLFSLVLSLSFFGVSSNAQELNIKPGMWEWSMTMEMPGMSFKMPPITYESCITKQDLVPQQSNPAQQCEMLHYEVTNSSVQWKVECTDEDGKTLSNGEILYKNTRAQGSIEILTNGMTMIAKLNGHRTGVCE